MAKNNNNLLAVLAIFVVVLSLISFGVTLYKFNQFKEQITGYASGYVNLTVTTATSINMSDDRVNWSGGTVNANEPNATLISYGNGAAVVTRGNWSTDGVDAMIVQNIGNVNCSLTIQSSKNASRLLGSVSGTNESFQWNVTNKDANSCINVSVGQLGSFVDVNITSGGTNFCSAFAFHDNRDEIYIDIALTVPPDTNSTFLGSEQTATLTILCT